MEKKLIDILRDNLVGRTIEIYLSKKNGVVTLYPLSKDTFICNGVIRFVEFDEHELETNIFVLVNNEIVNFEGLQMDCKLTFVTNG